MNALDALTFTLLADKLEATENPNNDLLVEAVGNDDGTLRKAIYRMTLCRPEDLISAQKGLFDAFVKYFKSDEAAANELNQAQENYAWVLAGMPSAMQESGHGARYFA